MSTYKPGEFEDKWNKVYAEKKIFQPEINTKKKKFFINVPVAYPDGRLHLGHLYTWTRADIYARFMRMKDYNVLWPQGWHFTGGPIIGMSIRLKDKDPTAIKIMEQSKVSKENIEKFASDPVQMGLYFSKTFKEDFELAGMSIDWRREFILSYTPQYTKFVEWQLRKLKDKGLITQGNHPVIWCPREDTSLGDHDRAEGEGESPMLFSIIKFKCGELILPVATLRPETVFGVTNIWINDKIKYRKIEVDGESWIVSSEFEKKLPYQLKEIKSASDFDISSIIKTTAVNPVNNEEIPVLNADFVDKDLNTGVVMSVPMHSPADYVYWEKVRESAPSLYKKPKKIIDVDGYENLIEDAVKKNGSDKPGLKEATRFVYKKEASEGKLNDKNGPLSGLTINEGREKAIELLKGLSAYDSIYELSGRVVCRCGSEGLVKMVQNQWFIKYSDKKLKEKAIDHVSRMNIYPQEARAQVINSIYNLEDKAMARRGGLGTPLPWDKEWIVEPLSDSTIYMAFYTISHIIKTLDPGDVNDELFDYVFLGEKPKHQITPKADEMKKEFEYWYPVNLRITAKELLTNHLIFFILNHVALFPEDKWPIGLGINGWLVINDIKMSKSKGNTMLISESIKEFGADIVRSIAATSNGIDDVKWSTSDINTIKQKFEFLMDTIEILNDFGDERRVVDRFLVSKLGRMVVDTESNYSQLKYRNAVFTSFFEGLDYLKFYLEAGGKNRETLKTFISCVIKLVHPIFPFITEELNSRLGAKTLLEESESWPRAEDYGLDEIAENEVSVLRSTVDDISKLIKITGKTPSRITIGIAPAEKFSTYNEIVESAKKTKNPKELRSMLKRQDAFTDRILKNPNRIPINELDIEIEKKTFEESKEYLTRIFNSEIKVQDSVDEKASPGRPKIELA